MPGPVVCLGFEDGSELVLPAAAAPAFVHAATSLVTVHPSG